MYNVDPVGNFVVKLLLTYVFMEDVYTINGLQLVNTLLPTLVTLGIFIDSSAEQLENALSPIVVTLGKEIDASA